MGIARVTRNFQITIPKDVRKVVDVKEGDEVMFVVDGSRVTLSKSDDDIIQRTAGIWSDMKETGVEFQRRIRKGWGVRLRKQYAAR